MAFIAGEEPDRAQPSLRLATTYWTDGVLEVLYDLVDSSGVVNREWSASWSTSDRVGEPVSPELLDRLRVLSAILAEHLKPKPLETPEGPLPAKVLPLAGFSIQWFKPDLINLFTRVDVSPKVSGKVMEADLSADHRRLLWDVIGSVEAETWREIRRRYEKLVGQPAVLPRRVAVFISYRKTQKPYAEAIARRLERESIEALWDEWVIQAGDSVSGRIEGMFQESRVCLVLWSADHQSGQWCNKELRTAISKTIGTRYRVIPIRLDDSPLPDLLADLRWVDLREWDTQFEDSMRQVIQAILGVEPKPR